MTASVVRRTRLPVEDAPRAPFVTAPRPWGLLVRHEPRPTLLERTAQGACLALALPLGTAALDIMAEGLVARSTGEAWMRLGLASILAAGAFLMLWFASRGRAPDIELDRARGELRLVVRHGIGGPERVATVGLDACDGLVVDRHAGRGRDCATLALRVAGGGSLPLARGPLAAVADLHAALLPDLAPRQAFRPGRAGDLDHGGPLRSAA